MPHVCIPQFKKTQDYSKDLEYVSEKLWICEAQPQRLLMFLTSAVIIHNRDSLPLEELHQVETGTAERREVRVEADVEGVLVVRHLVLPAGLDVGNPQSVADGLHGIGRRAV